MAAVVFQIKSTLIGPYGFHVGTVPALGLTLGDPQLLEENIRCVEERRRAAGPRTLLSLEVVELLGLQPRELGAAEVHVEVAAELGGCQARRAPHVFVDLEANLVARVKDGYEPVVADLEVDPAQIGPVSQQLATTALGRAPGGLRADAGVDDGVGRLLLFCEDYFVPRTG